MLCDILFTYMYGGATKNLQGRQGWMLWEGCATRWWKDQFICLCIWSVDFMSLSGPRMGKGGNRKAWGYGKETSWLIIYLPWKTLSFILRTHVKMTDMVACAWSPTVGEIEIGGFLGLTDQQARSVRDLASKKKRWMAPVQWYQRLSSETPVYAHTCAHILTFILKHTVTCTNIHIVQDHYRHSMATPV